MIETQNNVKTVLLPQSSNNHEITLDYLLKLNAKEVTKTLSDLPLETVKVLATNLVEAAQSAGNKAFDNSNWLNAAKDNLQIIKQINMLLSQWPTQKNKLDGIIDKINANGFPTNRYSELLHENLFETYQAEDGSIKVVQAQTFIAYAITKLPNNVLNQFLSSLREQIGDHQLSFYFSMPLVINGKETRLESWFLNEYEEENQEEKERLVKNRKSLQKFIKDCNLEYEPSVDSKSNKFVPKSQQIADGLSYFLNKIAVENARILEQKMSTEELIIWNSTGIITGAGKETLDDIYKATKPHFNEKFEDMVINTMLSQANEVRVPNSLKKKYNIERMTLDDICKAALNNLLPFMHYDEKKGYESTLIYLNRLHPNEDLINKIADEVINQAKAGQYFGLMYLANSNLDDSHTISILQKELKINKLKDFNAKELKVLVTSKDLDEFLKEIIDQDLPEIFLWYWKNIGFTGKDCEKQFSHIPGILHFAAKYGYLELVQELLKYEEGRNSIKMQGGIKYTPLFYLEQYTNPKIVLEFLKYNRGNQNIFKPYKQKLFNDLTPLHYAAQFKYQHVVQELLKHEEGKAATQLASVNGKTPIDYADQFGNRLVVQELLKYEEGKAAAQLASPMGKTSLHYAAKYANLNEAQKIIQSMGDDDAFITRILEDGETPLHKAVKLKNLDMVKALLEYEKGRKSILILDHLGYTPLKYAITLGNLEIMQELLKHNKCKGALRIKNGFHGRTPLHSAVSSSNLGKVKELLQYKEGDEAFQMFDNYGFTPLQLATDREDINIIKELLNNDEVRKTILIQNNEGETSLHIAAKSRSSLEVVQELLKYDESKKAILIQDKEGRTPLHLALYREQISVFTELFECDEGKKAISMQNEDGYTLLHIAVIIQRPDILKQLLKHEEGKKALSIQSEDGRTPLQLALKLRKDDIVEVLQKRDNSRKPISARNVNSDPTSNTDTVSNNPRVDEFDTTSNTNIVNNNLEVSEVDTISTSNTVNNNLEVDEVRNSNEHGTATEKSYERKLKEAITERNLDQIRLIKKLEYWYFLRTYLTNFDYFTSTKEFQFLSIAMAANEIGILFGIFCNEIIYCFTSNNTVFSNITIAGCVISNIVIICHEYILSNQSVDSISLVPGI